MTTHCEAIREHSPRLGEGLVTPPSSSLTTHCEDIGGAQSIELGEGGSMERCDDEEQDMSTA